ncbi:Relaxase/mobilization nuclease family protein [Alkaliphilus metalliredigens QYMF]|uniref:Relaxase/mobilization nuclease family protein n=1 Tax=Alkaliphilus metalliredigens (strain QYMF) TaxID=293826 RepID=A6TV37_ALKMQ|nr:relaxase/mobilization nuclease domain-containing protein [Alkaliphilus metalliredigens]ABR50055.1 Relaxase/mobilization nuclease family protein [Alkaliphilus metalliredigens QYMF]
MISSYKCGYKTAALQFENTKEIMNSQCKNLARHLIQSFIPGEATPTLAHQIGQELCEKHLKGKYEYVMTTHIDKGHIHNHIIFNNVSFVDGKAYISNKKSYHQIRNESDHICKDNGLSIITSDDLQNNNKTKGKSYKEYQEQKSGNSYKAKLKYTIDPAIKKSKDWDEFITLMQEYGYEIKHGQHISFKAINQERFTRAKTIGSDYSEELIKERIENRVGGKLNHTTRQRTPIKVVDIDSNKLASESAGFTRWLKPRPTVTGKIKGRDFGKQKRRIISNLLQ